MQGGLIEKTHILKGGKAWFILTSNKFDIRYASIRVMHVDDVMKECQRKTCTYNGVLSTTN